MPEYDSCNAPFGTLHQNAYPQFYFRGVIFIPADHSGILYIDIGSNGEAY